MCCGAAATGWTARCASRGALRDWRRLPTRCRPLKSSEGPAKWSPCWNGRARGRRRWSAKRRRTSSGFASQQIAEAEPTEASLRWERRRQRPQRPAELWPPCTRAPWRWPALRAQRQGDWWPQGGLGHRGRSQRGLAHAGLGRRDGRRHGQRRLAGPAHHGRPNLEQHAGFRRRGSLLHPRAAAAAAGLPDRHGFRERAASPASAADPSSPHPAPGPGPAAAHALRHQPGAHPGELRERTFPHQPAVPGRPWAAGHAVLRRPSHGERTGSCIIYKGWRT